MAGLADPVEVRIRSARREDLPAIVALRDSVGWSSGGIEGSFAAVDAGRQAILVAEVGGRTVGSVAMSFQVPASGGFRRGHISDLLVAPLWRRRGIARALLQAAEAAVAARGLPEVTLDVDAHNRAALALYFSSGYVHHRPAQFPWGSGYTLRKALLPEDERAIEPPLLGWWRRFTAGPRRDRL